MTSEPRSLDQQHALAQAVTARLKLARTGFVKPWKISSYLLTYEGLYRAGAARNLGEVLRDSEGTFGMEGVDHTTIEDVTVLVCESFGWS